MALQALPRELGDVGVLMERSSSCHGKPASLTLVYEWIAIIVWYWTSNFMGQKPFCLVHCFV